MDKLRAQGLCDWIGLTGLGDPGPLHQVIDSSRFDAVQIYYNLLNPTAMASAGPGWNSTDFDGLLNRCAAQDMGVMGIRILAAGHLASSERHGREVAITANAEDAAEEARAKAALARARATARNGRPGRVAIWSRLSAPLHHCGRDRRDQGISKKPWPLPTRGRSLHQPCRRSTTCGVNMRPSGPSGCYRPTS